MIDQKSPQRQHQTRSFRTNQSSEHEALFADMPTERQERNAFQGLILEETWKLCEELGAGGVGRVYRAEHCRSARPAAVKFLRPRFKVRDKYRARFLQEVRILKQLNHPHIVDLFDFGEDQVVGVFLVTEYLEGTDLSSYTNPQGGLLSWSQIATITDQLCDAMNYAHEAGIVHRDLKPENIFLMEQDHSPAGEAAPPLHVEVLDFGIAQNISSDALRLTQTGVTMGTPAYISPEQAMGHEIDHRADIYALGAILHELFTGKPLFPMENAYNAMKMHAFDPPPTLSEACPEQYFPPALETLLLESLHKDPNDRPQSMDEFRRRFKHALHTHQALPERLHPEATPQPLVSPLAARDQEHEEFPPTPSLFADSEPLGPLAQADTQAYTTTTPPLGVDVVQGIPLDETVEPPHERWGDFSNEWSTQLPAYQPSYGTNAPTMPPPHSRISYWSKRSALRDEATKRDSLKQRIARLLVWGITCCGIAWGISALMEHHPFG